MKKYLGIEFGSTRIKAVLIDESASVVCQGGYEWENKLNGGYWSYDLEEVKAGLRQSYSELAAAYKAKCGEAITALDGIGVSAMMHGYLAFDASYKLLTPFRTWRNTNTADASELLTRKLGFNMPMRWSAVHYFQAVLNGEPHINQVAHLHTLASYVHYLLTGKEVIGIGDASGMFPVSDGDYDREKLKKFDALLKEKGVNANLRSLLPKVLLAGENAGKLTDDGARLLDESGTLHSGAPACPPEGDAGTGMVATSAVRPRSGNVSAGTSAFAMIVLDKPLKKVYPEIDIVTTPAGKQVAMVHVNNCTSEINAWADTFAEVAELVGVKVDRGELIGKLFNKSLESGDDCGKLACYNFLSGEPIAGTEEGRPLVLRDNGGKLSLADFMQAQIYSALATLSQGMKILKGEGVAIDFICGHGGFFKTEFVGQNAMSAAIGAPVTVMKNAGEGGAWGVALLALYAAGKKGTLDEFLDGIFANADKTTVTASAAENKKFAEFMRRYEKYFAAEKLASEVR